MPPPPYVTWGDMVLWVAIITVGLGVAIIIAALAAGGALPTNSGVGSNPSFVSVSTGSVATRELHAQDSGVIDVHNTLHMEPGASIDGLTHLSAETLTLGPNTFENYTLPVERASSAGQVLMSLGGSASTWTTMFGTSVTLQGVVMWVDGTATEPGNGTETEPFQTLEEAFAQLNAYPWNGTARIYVNPGSYTLPNTPTYLINSAQSGSKLELVGVMQDQTTTLSVDSVGTVQASYEDWATVSVAGTPWGVNDYENMLISFEGGALADQTAWIVSNTTNTLMLVWSQSVGQPAIVPGQNFVIIDIGVDLSWNGLFTLDPGVAQTTVQGMTLAPLAGAQLALEPCGPQGDPAALLMCRLIANGGAALAQGSSLIAGEPTVAGAWIECAGQISALGEAGMGAKSVALQRSILFNVADSELHLPADKNELVEVLMANVSLSLGGPLSSSAPTNLTMLACSSITALAGVALYAGARGALTRCSVANALSAVALDSAEASLDSVRTESVAAMLTAQKGSRINVVGAVAQTLATTGVVVESGSSLVGFANFTNIASIAPANQQVPLLGALAGVTAADITGGTVSNDFTTASSQNCSISM